MRVACMTAGVESYVVRYRALMNIYLYIALVSVTLKNTGRSLLRVVSCALHACTRSQSAPVRDRTAIDIAKHRPVSCDSCKLRNSHLRASAQSACARSNSAPVRDRTAIDIAKQRPVSCDSCKLRNAHLRASAQSACARSNSAPVHDRTAIDLAKHRPVSFDSCQLRDAHMHVIA